MVGETDRVRIIKNVRKFRKSATIVSFGSLKEERKKRRKRKRKRMLFLILRICGRDVIRGMAGMTDKIVLYSYLLPDSNIEVML